MDDTRRGFLRKWFGANAVRFHAVLGHGCCVLSLLLCVTVQAQQQMADPDFKTAVERPAYSRKGPTVAIDEAHDNFHTAGGQYKPLADLLTSDGYRMIASTRKFEAGTLTGIDVLVIANARNLAALMARDLSSPTFTEHECDVVRDWVHSGGSLLLVADHAPFGNAAEILAKRFGVTMGKGWVFDRESTGGITTQLTFSRENGLLGSHPILRGRTASEEVKSIRSFTGQSLGVPVGATTLMRLGAGAREAPTPADLDSEEAAVRSGGASGGMIGAHSSPVIGRAQGIAMTFGKGRLVVLGEAALLSAQIVRFAEGNQQREMKVGMNVPGNDDRQFALNVLHWLSGLLK
ncbi:MAG TPA: DUF4350 domain-containing protein [Acidobacteriota bacterium]|jgi:hypothetical protein